MEKKIGLEQADEMEPPERGYPSAMTWGELGSGGSVGDGRRGIVERTGVGGFVAAAWERRRRAAGSDGTLARVLFAVRSGKEKKKCQRRSVWYGENDAGWTVR